MKVSLDVTLLWVSGFAVVMWVLSALAVLAVEIARMRRADRAARLGEEEMWRPEISRKPTNHEN